MLVLACQTGLRPSKLLALTVGDVQLGTGAHVSRFGKGRRQRVTPLTAGTAKLLKCMMAERAGLHSDPLFPNRRGTQLCRDALEQRLAKYSAIATSFSACNCSVAPSALSQLLSKRGTGHATVSRRWWALSGVSRSPRD